MRRLLSTTLFVLLACSATACVPKTQFYWGSYEDSLFSRHQQAGAGGEAEAVTMLVATINDAETANAKVGPGVHADYGYLLYKQGRADEAVAQLQKETALYPESKPLMNTMISRIQGRKEKDKEKKPLP